MRGLFFKVFIIFWIAQSLIFVISTALILNHRFMGPEPFFGPLFDDLQNEAQRAVSAYVSGGCSAFSDFARMPGRSVVLEDLSGHVLCRYSTLAINHLGSQALDDISGERVGQNYIWRIPVKDRAGERYVYWVSATTHGEHSHTWYQDLLHMSFPQLPVAIAVGGLTTFVLVLIFTRPVIRLRTAARELAAGRLDTRVIEPYSRARLFQDDEFQALVRDFNYMAERLESLVDAQKLLLRDVSHELRSPLARLSVALELAREDAEPRMADHLDRIERETNRLNQLIGQLLALSSMEAIDGSRGFEPLSLRRLLEEMTQDAGYEARQRHVSVALHAECECVIRGNRELLYSAIENVVRNAIRFTEFGSEVTIRLFSAAGDSVSTDREGILEVSDRGPGIPEKDIQAIFRPFYRVDSARSPQTGGFGVGLAIAERAVKLHNGHLKALNRADGGTIIQMRFPLLLDQPVLNRPTIKAV